MKSGAISGSETGEISDAMPSSKSGVKSGSISGSKTGAISDVMAGSKSGVKSGAIASVNPSASNPSVFRILSSVSITDTSENASG